MIAKIAYLTSPSPGRYILNFQPFGSDDLMRIEVAPHQMINILCDGTTIMLRSSIHRVPNPSTTENATNGSAASRA
jgi:hypothetical protein